MASLDRRLSVLENVTADAAMNDLMAALSPYQRADFDLLMVTLVPSESALLARYHAAPMGSAERRRLADDLAEAWHDRVEALQ